jgi:hypothetical protein
MVGDSPIQKTGKIVGGSPGGISIERSFHIAEAHAPAAKGHAVAVVVKSGVLDVGGAIMTFETKILVIFRTEQHKVIDTANGEVKSVMALGTVSYGISRT